MCTPLRSANSALLVLAAFAFALAVSGGGSAARPAAAAEVSSARSARPEERELQERVRAYWEARMAGSERVFAFYTPPERGGPRARSDVSERGNLRFTGFEIEKVELRGDEGTVVVRVEAASPDAGTGAPLRSGRSARVREAWDRVDGTWYKRPVPRGFGR